VRLFKSNTTHLFSISCIILYTLVFSSQLRAQNIKDTVSYKAFEVVENKVPNAFKATEFDSTSIRNSENLAELLQKHSSVFIKSYGSGSLATVSFRGTGASHTKVQWNGVTLNSPMNGQIDFSLFPTFFFDDAAIHYGASGLTDGNGALGGSVLLNNTETYNKGLSIHLNQEIGSYNNLSSNFSVKASSKKLFTEVKLYIHTADNNFDFVNSSKKENPIETQTNAELKQYGLMQAVYRKLKNSSIGFRYIYLTSERNLPHAMNINDNDENQKDESFRGLVEWKGFHNNLQYQLTSAIVKNQLIYDNQLADIYSLNKSLNSDNNINTKLYLKNYFTIESKINIKYETAKADGYDKEHQRLNNSWLIAINKDFKRLSLNLMNRLIVVGDNFQPIAPSLGMRFQLLKQQQLYLKANAGINYNYPTFNDLYWNPGGNSALKPEKAKMSEVGLSYTNNKKKHTLHTELTGFYGMIDDWIIWQQTEFGYWSPSNIREVENKGIEALINYKTSFNKLTINNQLNYSYTASTNKLAKNDNDNSVDKQLIYVPFHQFNYNLQAAYQSFSAIYTFSYSGKRFITTDNNWYLPANYLSDISLNKKFKLKNKFNLLLRLKALNIFNQNYQSIAWRPMPGRNYSVSVTLNFN